MTLPVGVATKTVRIRLPIDVLGVDAKFFSGTIRPDRPLVWSATKQPIWPVAADLPAPVAGVIELPVPTVNQAGMVTPAGVPITGWAYVVTVKGTWPGTSWSMTKTFQVFTASVSPVDWDVVPDGTSVPPVPGYAYDAGAISYGAGSVGDALGDRVPKSLVDAKGDLLVGTAADTVGRLPVGATGRQLFADSTTATGLRWGSEGEMPKEVLLSPSDFNTYINPGLFFINLGAVANRPATPYGHLHVSVMGGQISQEFTTSQTNTNPARRFLRTSLDAGATWNVWVEVMTTAPGSGSTGWRRVVTPGDLADMSMLGVSLKRVGDTVRARVSQNSGGTSAATGTVTLYTLPSGFIPESHYAGMGAPILTTAAVNPSGLPITGSTLLLSAGTAALRLVAVPGQRHYADLSWTTDDGWPSTLPGTAQ